MDKSKLIWYTLLFATIIIVLNFAVNLFNKSEISKAKDDINAAKAKIDYAIYKIDSAQNKINGLISNIDTAKNRLNAINISVDNLNLNMETKINTITYKIKLLKDSIKADQKDLNLLKKELEELK